MLVGSGISRSAGIPTGWEVTTNLIKRVAAMHGEDQVDDLDAWYRNQFDEEPGYSAILERLSKTPAERRAILQSFFEPTESEREDGLKLPTLAHRSIAKLVSKGFIRVIVTTNFDRLMETALVDEGITPVVISTSDGVSGAAPLIHQKCVILKLHGDYLDDRIKNTADELSVYSDELNQYLDRILDEFGLLICGWSGEWDPALRSAIERCPSRRYATYWTTRGDLKPAVQKLATLRGAQAVPIQDADSFLDGVAEKVAALAELAQDDPKSLVVKRALLKKYIADPRHRVRLADLLNRERDGIVGLHDATGGRQAPEGATEFARNRFKQYDVSTTALCALVFDAAKWGEDIHDPIIQDAIKSIIPPAHGNGLVILLELMIYPAVQVFYHALAGCILGQNYRLFKRLLKMQFTFRGRLETSMPRLTASYCIEINSQQSLCDTRQYFPFSEHILKLLTPLLNEHGVDTEKFYVTLETWLALLVIDENDDPTVSVYQPYGTFMWNHEDRRRSPILEEARLQGEDWPPYRAGYFSGSFERLEAVSQALEEKIAQNSNRFW